MQNVKVLQLLAIFNTKAINNQKHPFVYVWRLANDSQRWRRGAYYDVQPTSARSDDASSQFHDLKPLDYKLTKINT